MKKIIFLFLCCLFTCGCSSTKLESKTITCDELNSLVNEEEILILDVRTKEEYALSHIEGSILLPYTEIESEVSSLIENKDSKIVVYCKSGKRSGEAAKTLLSLGYKNVYDLGAGESCKINKKD